MASSACDPRVVEKDEVDDRVRFPDISLPEDVVRVVEDAVVGMEEEELERLPRINPPLGTAGT